jgi:hypothetical protein
MEGSGGSFNRGDARAQARWGQPAVGPDFKEIVCGLLSGDCDRGHSLEKWYRSRCPLVAPPLCKADNRK